MFDVSFEKVRRTEKLGKRESRLGLYLRLLRSETRKTLREIAEESHDYSERVSTSLLADAEKGAVVPSAAKLLPLAKLYRVSPQRFLDLIDLDGQGHLPEAETSWKALEAEAEAEGDHLPDHHRKRPCSGPLPHSRVSRAPERRRQARHRHRRRVVRA